MDSGSCPVQHCLVLTAAPQALVSGDTHKFAKQNFEIWYKSSRNSLHRSALFSQAKTRVWCGRQVRQDGVQVLVELTGQTANNRLGVMALQPAPLQLTWIGYPNSTGLKAVQFRLTGTCSPP